MTRAQESTLRRLPGLQHTDHVGLTVPNLDEGIRFFVEVLGAEELYRSERGPDEEFMPTNFDVPADAKLTLAMLRLPPNLNIELFEWSSTQRRGTRRGTATPAATTCASSWTTSTKRSQCCRQHLEYGCSENARKLPATAPE
ncbi:glyoxalase/Bleomycin resistance protein/dioxygenase [Arthrobacter sp. Hiyo8]|nr:glyoxalase/Bleomycin resistance protein/dioxygenase [Arthrobacter sp. Hiyo8]